MSENIENPTQHNILEDKFLIQNLSTEIFSFRCPFYMQWVFFHSSSETGLLWDCFWSSEVFNDFWLTQRSGANYFYRSERLHKRVWQLVRKVVSKRKKLNIWWFEHDIQGVPKLVLASINHFLNPITWILSFNVIIEKVLMKIFSRKALKTPNGKAEEKIIFGTFCKLCPNWQIL